MAEGHIFPFLPYLIREGQNVIYFIVFLPPVTDYLNIFTLVNCGCSKKL
jgi:hypothetical protein